MKAAPLWEETITEVVPQAISNSCKVLYILGLLLESPASRLKDSKNKIVVIGIASHVTMFSESKSFSESSLCPVSTRACFGQV